MLEAFKPPKLIFTAESKYCGTVEVYERQGKRWISVGDTAQSISVNDPSVTKRTWGKLADLLLAEKPEAKNVLLLGLGGGTVPTLLSKKIPEAKITAVEIDEVMIEVAEKFFDLKAISNLTVAHADAFEYVADQKEKFDAVLVDLYLGEEFPGQANSEEFLANVKSLLKPDGIAILNRIYYLPKFRVETDQFLTKFRKHFKNVKTLQVAGFTGFDNILIYGRI